MFHIPRHRIEDIEMIRGILFVRQINQVVAFYVIAIYLHEYKAAIPPGSSLIVGLKTERNN